MLFPEGPSLITFLFFIADAAVPALLPVFGTDEGDDSPRFIVVAATELPLRSIPPRLSRPASRRRAT